MVFLKSGACKKVYYPVGLDLYALEKEEKAQTADNVEQSRLSAYKRDRVVKKLRFVFTPYLILTIAYNNNAPVDNENKQHKKWVFKGFYRVGLDVSQQEIKEHEQCHSAVAGLLGSCCRSYNFGRYGKNSQNADYKKKLLVIYIS